MMAKYPRPSTRIFPDYINWALILKFKPVNGFYRYDITFFLSVMQSVLVMLSLFSGLAISNATMILSIRSTLSTEKKWTI